MFEFELCRDADPSPERTFGRITAVFRCDSLELPLLQNLARKSAIPEGRYRVTLYDSPSMHDEVLLLHDVPGRSWIEFHPANEVTELLGCAACGMRRTATGLALSRPAFVALREIVRAYDAAGEEVWVVVRSGVADDAGTSARA